MTPPALILARIDAIGAANVARAVAPSWRCSQASAASRLTRYRNHLLSRPGRDLTTAALWPLLAALNLTISPP